MADEPDDDRWWWPTVPPQQEQVVERTLSVDWSEPEMTVLLYGPDGEPILEEPDRDPAGFDYPGRR